jgi:L-fuculose-phosphate aldolase
MYKKEREEMCQVAQIMFDRKLTNAAGGNISVRMNEEHVIMTPSLMSEEYFCRLRPEQILVTTLDGEIIEGEGKITRESNMHLGIYKNLPDANCVLHAHPKETMVYISLAEELPSATEATDKFGEVKVLPYAKSCSEELANIAIEYFKTREEELKKHGLIALLRRHGIVIVDKDLKTAFNGLERTETNAYVNLHANKF